MTSEISPKVPQYLCATHVIPDTCSNNTITAPQLSSGILVSKPAILALRSSHQKCVKYAPCTTTPSLLLALCLQDTRTPLTSSPHMHATAPGDDFNWIHPACSNPATLPSSSLAITSQKTPLRYSHLFAHYSSSRNLTLSTGYDRDEHDYRVYIATHAVEDCIWACGEDPLCAAWSYEPLLEKCVLKNAVGRKVAKKGVISGVLKNRYFCFMDELY